MGVVSQSAADAERYKCVCAGRGDGISAASTGGVIVGYKTQELF